MTEEEVKDSIVTGLFNTAEQIGQEVLEVESEDYHQFDRKLDSILMSKKFGIPVMLALLGVVFGLPLKVLIIRQNY